MIGLLRQRRDVATIGVIATVTVGAITTIRVVATFGVLVLHYD